MEKFAIDLGIAALLRVLESQKDRRSWARAIAKVFAAIDRARLIDPVLAEAIKAKQEGR